MTIAEKFSALNRLIKSVFIPSYCSVRLILRIKMTSQRSVKQMHTFSCLFQPILLQSLPLSVIAIDLDIYIYICERIDCILKSRPFEVAICNISLSTYIYVCVWMLNITKANWNQSKSKILSKSNTVKQLR